MFIQTKKDSGKIETDLKLDSEISPPICYLDDSFNPLPLERLRLVTKINKKRIEQRIWGINLDGIELNIRYGRLSKRNSY